MPYSRKTGRGERYSGEYCRAGPIWTALQISGGQTQDKIPQFGQQTPMKRAGQPAELAPVYVYLASQESSYVTAEVHGVCGGEHLG